LNVPVVSAQAAKVTGLMLYKVSVSVSRRGQK
jgi:hypothetical protein